MHDEQRSSTHMEAKVRAVEEGILKRGISMEAGKSKLVSTRNKVERGWLRVSEILLGLGQPELAQHVCQFTKSMPAPLTEQEHIAAEVIRNRSRQQVPKKPSITR